MTTAAAVADERRSDDEPLAATLRDGELNRSRLVTDARDQGTEQPFGATARLADEAGARGLSLLSVVAATQLAWAAALTYALIHLLT
jgi:hypothetical protein